MKINSKDKPKTRKKLRELLDEVFVYCSNNRTGQPDGRPVQTPPLPAKPALDLAISNTQYPKDVQPLEL